MSAPAASHRRLLDVRAVLRVVLVVVAVVLTLVLMYLLRRPLTWIFIAAFLAIALSGPITLLSRRMRRGFAVAIVYLLLILTPFALIGLLVPPIVTQANNLVQNLPEYAQEVTEFVNENDRLRQLQDDYDITGKLEEQAAKLPARLGDAAGVLGDIGVGLVNSIFAAVTIIVLSLFMLCSGRRFLDAWIREYQPDREEWWHNLFARIGNAIGNYVAGALLQATIAGVTSWIDAADPRRRLRAAARGRRLPARPDPARRRHARRDHRRHRHAVLGLPGRHASSGRCSRSSTSRSRTTSSSRGSRPARSSSTR